MITTCVFALMHFLGISIKVNDYNMCICPDEFIRHLHKSKYGIIARFLHALMGFIGTSVKLSIE